MKKIISLFSVVLFLIILCGCLSTTEVHSPKEPTTSTTTASPTNEQQRVEFLSVAELGKEALPVYYQQWGNVSSKNSTDMVAVVSANIDDVSIETDVYLVAEIDGTNLIYSLGKWEYRVLKNGSLTVVDLNQDGIDEIVLFMEVTGNGGTIAQIFKIANNTIQMECDLNTYDLGLHTEYQNGYQMLIANQAANFSHEIDVQLEFVPDVFDENGKAEATVSVYTQPISRLAIHSAEDGNLPKICCEYGIKVTNYLGVLQVEFQYNSETNVLTIATMKFIDNNAGD